MRLSRNRRPRASADGGQGRGIHVRPAVAGLPFTAADLESASRALERLVPPLHPGAAAQADLDGGRGRRSTHSVTVARDEDGYDFKTSEGPAEPGPLLEIAAVELRD